MIGSAAFIAASSVIFPKAHCSHVYSTVDCEGETGRSIRDMMYVAWREYCWPPIAQFAGPVSANLGGPEFTSTRHDVRSNRAARTIFTVNSGIDTDRSKRCRNIRRMKPPLFNQASSRTGHGNTIWVLLRWTAPAGLRSRLRRTGAPLRCAGRGQPR